MHRIVTVMLIGFLALFSVLRPGGAMAMTHGTDNAAFETVTQDFSAMSHHHGSCADCSERGDTASGEGRACPHGALCLAFTEPRGVELGDARMMLFADYPSEVASSPMARAPALDLPPPRIGFDLV